MSISEASPEKEIQEKGLNAPRLNPAHIDATIWGCQFWNPEGTTLTICAMQLQNGFMVIGKSAAASPENFDEEIGKNVAYDHAREQVWELEGYLLRQKLFEQDTYNATHNQADPEPV